MQLLAPDILADLRGLSPALCIAGLVVGLALWLLGWWSHRFWVVLSITVIGGILGLAEGPALRAQPLVAAVLLALAAGLLALAVIRLVAFAAGGITFLALAQALGPPGDNATIYFLAGGLMGIVLFRLWVMALTSLGGSILVAYSGLCLADSLGSINAPNWATYNVTMLNWLCGGGAAIGLALQLYLNRRKPESKGKGKSSKGKKGPPKEQPQFTVEEKPARGWGARLFRRAG
jgi:hypothetical protein